MIKAKKLLASALAFLFVFSSFLIYGTAKAATKQLIPKIKFVNTPRTEYTVGERVRFDVSAPNYGHKVEYRVILWDDSTKTPIDLWNASNGYPTRYYTKWQPWGNNVFTLGWPIFKPGTYRITVYVKRVGVPNNKAYLKGQNCDDYVESVPFVVKPDYSLLDKEGVYGSKDAAKPEPVKTDVSITANNVTLNNVNVEGNVTVTGDKAVIKNATVTGKIVLNPGKDGSVTLENVTAKTIEVLSGAKDSIHIKNVKTEGLNVSSTSPVRIETDGDTEIVSTTANGYVIFDKKSGTFGTITVTKSESGETVIEFRGEIKDKVIVEAPAAIKTAEGSKIENIAIATANATDKVTLEGTFANVEVAKEAVVDVSAGSKVDKVDVKANAKITVAKDAVVETIDKNNNTVEVDNQGTINNEENTGGTTPGGGSGGVVVPPVQEVTNENTALNSALNSIIANLNSFELPKNVFGTISSLPANGKANTLTLTFNSPYSNLTSEQIVAAAKKRVIAHGTIEDSDTREISSLANMSALLDSISVNGMPIKQLMAAKLNAIGKTRTADFISNMTPEKYNVLYGALTYPAADTSYENLIGILHALIPGNDVTINSLICHGLTLQTVSVSGTTLYNVAGTDKTLTVSEIKTALGLGSADTRNLTPMSLDGDSIVVTFKGQSGTLYTYTLNFNCN